MITTGKKRYSCLLAGNWQFLCCGGKFSLRPEKNIYITPGKKRYSRLSDGCPVLASTTGKKKDKVVCLTGCAVVLFFVVAGNFDYDRKKKIQSSVGGKLAVFVLWREIFIMTGTKKSSSRLSGGCVSFWFWREIGSLFVVAGNFHYDRKKKKFQSSVWRVCQFLVLAGNWQFFCCGWKFSLRPEK